MAQDYENYDAMLERVRKLVDQEERQDRPDLSVAEAAEVLDVEPDVVLTWCRRADTFPHAYTDRRGEYRIPFVDIEAMRRGGRLHDLQEPIVEE